MIHFNVTNCRARSKNYYNKTIFLKIRNSPIYSVDPAVISNPILCRILCSVNANKNASLSHSFFLCSSLIWCKSQFSGEQISNKSSQVKTRGFISCPDSVPSFSCKQQSSIDFSFSVCNLETSRNCLHIDNREYYFRRQGRRDSKLEMRRPGRHIVTVTIRNKN